MLDRYLTVKPRNCSFFGLIKVFNITKWRFTSDILGLVNSLEVILIIRVRVYTFFDAARKSSAEVCRLSYTSFSDPFVVELDVFDVWYSTFFLSFYICLQEYLVKCYPTHGQLLLFFFCCVKKRWKKVEMSLIPPRCPSSTKSTVICAPKTPFYSINTKELSI